MFYLMDWKISVGRTPTNDLFMCEQHGDYNGQEFIQTCPEDFLPRHKSLMLSKPHIQHLNRFV